MADDTCDDHVSYAIYRAAQNLRAVSAIIAAASKRTEESEREAAE